MVEIATAPVKAVRKKAAPKKKILATDTFLTFEELIPHAVNHLATDNKLATCKILGVTTGTFYPGDTIHWSIIVCLDPEVRLVNYNFNELRWGKEFERKFELAFPYRYMSIGISFNKTSLSVGAHINKMFFSATELYNYHKDVFKPKSQIGSFLSNSRAFDQDTTFCANWSYSKYYTKTLPMPVDFLAEALYAAVNNYYWSSYNNHWYASCYASPSTFMLIRDLCTDVEFESALFSALKIKASDPKIKTIKDFTSSEYYQLVSPYRNAANNADVDQVKDYYKMLEALEQNPNYWNELKADQIISYEIATQADFYTKSMIPLDNKKPKLFVNALLKKIGIEK